MTTPIQKGNSVLRPRARIIKTIGEDLISSDIVAIIELVKNSYDADAEIITIEFNGTARELEEGRRKKKKRVILKEGCTISISDDGSGMSLETIQKAWMEPATVIKKQKRESDTKGRKHTGEKGIGRFASAKLANKLKIITKPLRDNEFVADFNWQTFEDESKYLDQIKCEWEVRDPQTIKEKGTILILSLIHI